MLQIPNGLTNQECCSSHYLLIDLFQNPLESVDSLKCKVNIDIDIDI